MTKSLQQLENDLADLEKQVLQFSPTFFQKYQQYLDILSQLTRKELILVSYQVCTEIHPSRFLEISVNQRGQIQEKIRNYANSIENRLKTAMDFFSNESGHSSEDGELKINEYLVNAKKPQELLMWSNNVEHTIDQIFNHYSDLLNRYFIETKILPDNIPSKILELVSDSQNEGPNFNGYTSLVQLVITADETATENKDFKISNVVVIYLNRVKLELANPVLERAHRQIRSHYEQLKAQTQTYKKNEQELIIAKSQSAWRALWYDQVNPSQNPPAS